MNKIISSRSSIPEGALAPVFKHRRLCRQPSLLYSPFKLPIHHRRSARATTTKAGSSTRCGLIVSTHGYRYLGRPRVYVRTSFHSTPSSQR